MDRKSVVDIQSQLLLQPYIENNMVTRNINRSLSDFLRGIAIILMLWGHSVQYCCIDQFDYFDNIVYKVIYAFHMPFFMMISGYLFFFSVQKRDLVELIEYRTKSLLYPVLMCSVLNLLLTNGLRLLIMGGGQGHIGLFGSTPVLSLWFLWSVIACSIAIGFAFKTTQKSTIQVMLILTGIPFVAIFPWWEMNVYMYPYFLIGFLFSKNRDKIKKYFPIIGTISLVIFAFMLFYFEKKHYIYTSGLLGGETLIDTLTIDIFRWSVGLFGSVAAAWICMIIYYVMHGRIINFVVELGKESLAVYALSVSLLSYWLPIIMNAIISKVPINWNNCIWLYNFVFTPIVATAYIVLFHYIILFMKKYRAYRLFFGR